MSKLALTSTLALMSTLALAACAADPGTTPPATTLPAPATPTSAQAGRTPDSIPCGSGVSSTTGHPVTAAEICAGTVEVPSWGNAGADAACPHGPAQLTWAGPVEPGTDRYPGIVKVLNTDVDSDGVAEAVVLLSCQLGDPPIQQVFAVGRTAGGLRTLGPVVGPGYGGVTGISDLAVNPDGTVRVQVHTIHGSAPSAAQSEIFQWRTYGWDGHQFRQTAGSTSFEADRSRYHLTVAVSPIAFDAPRSGSLAGTFTITVRNTGTATAPVTVRTILDDGVTEPSSGGCRSVPPRELWCVVGDLPPGQARQVTVRLRLPSSRVDEYRTVVGANPDGAVQLLLRDQLYTVVPGPTATFP